MYRTDKQFMKNPATAGARIYVGGLNKTTVTDDLENLFQKHGTIVGLSLKTGFAFLQFENESEAQSAIRAENGAYLNGRKIVVKKPFDNNKPLGNPQQQQKGPMGGPSGPPSRGPPPKQEQSPRQSNQNQVIPQKTPPPPLQNEPKPDLSFQPPEREAEFQEENYDDDRPNIRPPPGSGQFGDDRGNRGGRKRGGPGGGRGGGGPRGKSNDRERFDRERESFRFEPPPPDAHREQFYGRDNYGVPPPRIEPFAPPVVDVPPPAPEKNDCEIIVVAKALTEYAEFIEKKLKNLGLIVDLLFPNEDVPIGKVLANISSRGCLYAILVMPINEEHRSLTLNILHGMPQEHRNMPIEDALILMSRNFEAYMKGEHLPPENPAEMTLLDRHPTSVQLIFNLLAENRQLTSTQYDQIIKYLQERRELQREYEISEGIAPDTQDPNSKEAELQNRILNILNKSNDTPIPTSITAPDPVAPTNEAPILKDPSVQKALDSLMLGDMFKNIASTA